MWAPTPLPHSSILPYRRCWGCSVFPEGKAHRAHSQEWETLEGIQAAKQKYKTTEGWEGNASKMAARQQG